jgi:hypothetical protein
MFLHICSCPRGCSPFAFTPPTSSSGRRAHAPLPSERPKGFESGVGRARGRIEVARSDTRHSTLGLCRVGRGDVVYCRRERLVREGDICLLGASGRWGVSLPAYGLRRARASAGDITWGGVGTKADLISEQETGQMSGQVQAPPLQEPVHAAASRVARGPKSTGAERAGIEWSRVS